MLVDFTLTGKMPLLMHADNVEGSALLDEWRKAPENKNLSVPGDDRSPPWTWQTYCYSDGIHIVMPHENIMVALRNAGTQLTLKRQKTFKEISQSGLLMQDEYCEFRAGKNQVAIDDLTAMRDRPFAEQSELVKKMGFSLFAKRARVGQAKHVRVRPRFDAWSVSGTIAILKPEITYEVLVKLFDLAGSVGLCDWRPGCRTPGPYGMFTSELKPA